MKIVVLVSSVLDGIVIHSKHINLQPMSVVRFERKTTTKDQQETWFSKTLQLPSIVETKALRYLAEIYNLTIHKLWKRSFSIIKSIKLISRQKVTKVFHLIFPNFLFYLFQFSFLMSYNFNNSNSNSIYLFFSI